MTRMREELGILCWMRLIELWVLWSRRSGWCYPALWPLWEEICCQWTSWLLWFGGWGYAVDRCGSSPDVQFSVQYQISAISQRTHNRDTGNIKLRSVESEEVRSRKRQIIGRNEVVKERLSPLLIGKF
eukprot:scaffold26232_cov76-Cyclotella_meneghiniana.AAC.1